MSTTIDEPTSEHPIIRANDGSQEITRPVALPIAEQIDLLRALRESRPLSRASDVRFESLIADERGPAISYPKAVHLGSIQELSRAALSHSREDPAAPDAFCNYSHRQFQLQHKSHTAQRSTDAILPVSTNAHDTRQSVATTDPYGTTHNFDAEGSTAIATISADNQKRAHTLMQKYTPVQQAASGGRYYDYTQPGSELNLTALPSLTSSMSHDAAAKPPHEGLSQEVRAGAGEVRSQAVVQDDQHNEVTQPAVSRADLRKNVCAVEFYYLLVQAAVYNFFLGVHRWFRKKVKKYGHLKHYGMLQWITLLALVFFYQLLASMFIWAAVASSVSNLPDYQVYAALAVWLAFGILLQIILTERFSRLNRRRYWRWSVIVSIFITYFFIAAVGVVFSLHMLPNQRQQARDNPILMPIAPDALIRNVWFLYPAYIAVAAACGLSTAVHAWALARTYHRQYSFEYRERHAPEVRILGNRLIVSRAEYEWMESVSGGTKMTGTAFSPTAPGPEPIDLQTFGGADGWLRFDDYR